MIITREKKKTKLKVGRKLCAHQGALTRDNACNRKEHAEPTVGDTSQDAELVLMEHKH